MPVSPAFRIPRRSGPHRIAAVALYRALLSQCRRVSIEPGQRDELQNLIRIRFKQSRRDQSIARLKLSFEAGYEAIDLFDAAVAGDEARKSRILELLEEAPLRARQPPPPCQIPAAKRTGASLEGAEEATKEQSTRPKLSLFDRPIPLSELSGKRHVPVLVSANKIPMLRIKKPIPEHLSGYIAHRVKSRLRRHNRKDRLEAELSLAEQEDQWDNLVRSMQSGEQGRDSIWRYSEPNWSDAIDEEIGVVQRQLSEERRKNTIMAEKMQGVVDREKALFEKERAERRERRAQRLQEGISSTFEEKTEAD